MILELLKIIQIAEFLFGVLPLFQFYLSVRVLISIMWQEALVQARNWEQTIWFSLCPPHLSRCS